MAKPVLDQYKTTKVRKVIQSTIDFLDEQETEGELVILHLSDVTKLISKLQDIVDFINDEISELDLTEDLS